MEVLTLDELQDLCRRRGLESMGSKEALIELLVQSSKAANDSRKHTPSATVRAPDDARFRHETKNYDTMAVPQLKDLCRRRSLPVGGIKKDIVARLKARDQSETPAGDHVRDAAVTKTASTKDRSSKFSLLQFVKEIENKKATKRTRVFHEPDSVSGSDVQPATPTVRSTPSKRPPSTKDRSSKFRLTDFVMEIKKKKATKRALVFHRRDAVSKSGAGHVTTTVNGTPSKPPSEKLTSPNPSSQKGAVQRLASPFAISSSKASEEGAVGKKRKISTPSKSKTGVSPNPNKVRKIQSFFALQSPNAASPKKMVQLSLAQCLGKQKPATHTLQKCLNEVSVKRSPAKQSLSAYMPAGKSAKATTVSSPKRNIFIVYTTTPSCSCELVKAFTSLPEANARVRQEFYENRPDGRSVEDIDFPSTGVDVTYEKELLTLAMRPPHKTWKVGAVAVAVGSSKVSEVEECFVVCSHQANEKEAPGSTPITIFHQVFTKKTDANAYATTVFDDKNPWGDELAKERGVRRSIDGGMLSMSKTGSGGAAWTVSVMVVGLADAPRNKKLLEPVMMSSTKPSRGHALTSFFPAGNPSTSRSSATASNPSTQKVSKQECFVVYSSLIFREERRGKRKEPEYEFYPPVKTKVEATALAEAVFYTLNPWGWTMSQFASKHVDKTIDSNRHMKMSVRDTDTWEVCVAAVRTSTHVAEADPASGILVYTVRGNEMSTQERPQDPKVKVETILEPHEVNGMRIEELFCECNPHKWDREHFKDSKITKTFEDGMFTVSAKPAASKASWVMKCTPFTRKTVPENTPEDTASPPRAALETRVKIES